MTPTIDSLFDRLQDRFPASDEALPGEGDASETGPAPLPPCRKTEHAKVGYDIDLIVRPDQISEAAGLLDEEKFAIDMITGVDWPDAGEFELVYDFLHFEARIRVAVHTRIPRDEPEIASLADIFPGANWHERETAEFYGIQFTGHPNPIHLLLPEDFEGFPLRKDFKPAPASSP